MQRFWSNTFKEIRTTIVGLILLAAGIYVAVQAEMETTLRATLAIALVTAGIAGLGIKDPKKRGGGRNAG